MPIKIDFLAQATKFLRETDRVESALDDVADSVDEMSRDGDRGAERLERSFREIANEARDTGRVIDREIGDVGPRGFRRLGDAGAEVGGELRQNLGETISSFRGDLADLPQVAQDTLGGLAGSGALGGIPGLALTVAGAAGLGLITTALQEQQDEAARLKEAMAGMYRAAVEEGRAWIDEAQILAAVNDVLFDPEKESLYKQAERDARTLGVEVNDVLRAQAGDQDKINLLLASGKARAEEMRDATYGTRDANIATAAELGNTIGRYEEIAGLADENRARAERALEIEEEMGAEERSNISRAQAADAARWQALAGNVEAVRKRAQTPVVTPMHIAVNDAGLRDIENRVASLSGRVISVRLEGQTGPGRYIL